MQAFNSSIVDFEADVIVNAANGQGILGSGVAGAIRKAAGNSLTREVREFCLEMGGFEEGDCYISSAGDLGNTKAVYHVVTMKFPGGRTNLDIVEKGMRKALSIAIMNNVKSIAFPGLGTGTGGLDIGSAAHLMVSVANDYKDKVNISIVDIDADFIQRVQKEMETCNNG
jgi:O-acetyl-ADP-ribose deacetylase (regulator of RNase III)